MTCRLAVLRKTIRTKPLCERFLADWTNALYNYNTRVTNLRAGVSGIRLQATGAGATVFDDGASVDTMTGGTETDWYFSSAINLITEFAIGALVDTLV